MRYRLCFSGTIAYRITEYDFFAYQFMMKLSI